MEKMNEKNYKELLRNIEGSFKEPSKGLEMRIIRNSHVETTKSKSYMTMVYPLMMCAIILLVFASFNKNLNNTEFVVNKNYVASFDLNSLKLDDASFVEVELPDNISLVSKNKSFTKKKKFIFVWSIFSESKLVSLPFKAIKAGSYSLKLNVLNESMEVIGVKTMNLNIGEG